MADRTGSRKLLTLSGTPSPPGAQGGHDYLVLCHPNFRDLARTAFGRVLPDPSGSGRQQNSAIAPALALEVTLPTAKAETIGSRKATDLRILVLARCWYRGHRIISTKFLS